MFAADEDLCGHQSVVGQPVVALLVAAELGTGAVQSRVGLVGRPLVFTMTLLGWEGAYAAFNVVPADAESREQGAQREAMGLRRVVEMALEPLPEPTGDWRADLAAMARRLRTAVLRHPWIAGAMTTRPALGPNALR